jgi:hypothetical protein
MKTKAKYTEQEQVAMIKDDLRRDLAVAFTTPDPAHAEWCHQLIARTDWTAEQFIYNRIPPAP